MNAYEAELARARDRLAELRSLNRELMVARGFFKQYAAALDEARESVHDEYERVIQTHKRLCSIDVVLHAQEQASETMESALKRLVETDATYLACLAQVRESVLELKRLQPAVPPP